jgi:hypothetical protein
MYRTVERCQTARPKPRPAQPIHALAEEPNAMIKATSRARSGSLSRIALAWLGASALLASAPGWRSTAAACDCAPLTPSAAYRRADAVFEGRVRGLEPSAQAGAPQRVRFEVVRAWKGVGHEQLELTTAANAGCGAELALDHSYFVYAVEQEGHLMLGPCSRTRPMADADEDLQALGMGVTPVDPKLDAPDAGQPKKPHRPPARGGCASCQIASATRGAPIAPWAWLATLGLAALGVRVSRRARQTGLSYRRSESRP